MTQMMDPKTKELVGIAAAVAGHCEPCFAHHYKEAKALGVATEAIQSAIELARAVRASGDSHMDEFVMRRTDHDIQGTAETDL